MQDARDSALSIVKGHRVAELMTIGEEIYDEYMADRIWPGTRALAQAHLDAGQKVWLVTAAPVEIATVIMRPPRTDRRARHRRGVRRRRLHRTARRRTPARPRQGRGGPRAGHRRDPGPDPLRRLQRLPQRHPHAVPGRPPLRDQPGRQAPQARPRPRLAAARLPHRPQGREGRHPRGGGRRRGHAAARPPPSPCTAGPAARATTAPSARAPPRHRPDAWAPGRPRTRTHVHPDEPSGAAPPMSTTHPHPPCIDPVWSTTCHSPTLEPTPIDNRSDVIDDLSNWA